MNLSPTGKFLVLTGAIVALLAAVNARFCFATPFHEQADYAVNALQIDRAKALAELHGNYSRYNFDHPGPAFFYVYALGEAVLFDGLHLTASPHGAHVLAGLALQACFFALALGIAASWVRAPLFLPLALLAGAVHFTLAGGPLLSSWPPDVLVMPVLAFFVSCVAVAGGRSEHLPWAVLSGGFLVHGHVAQALFVPVLFVVACAGLARTLKRAGIRHLERWREIPAPYLWSVVLLAVFLLPIGLDLLRGGHSNFIQILRFVRGRDEAPKSLADSAQYALAFLAYFHGRGPIFTRDPAGWLSFLRSEAAALLPWAFLLAATVAVAFGHNGRAGGETRRFLRIGLGFGAITAGLCLVWGANQTGAMYAFNSVFYYGFLYALLLLVCGALSASAPATPARWARPALYGTAAVVAAWGLRIPMPTPAQSGIPLHDATLAALRRDPHPAAPKLVVFAPDDWSTAASAALALERAGRAVYFDPAWSFMFQRCHALPRALGSNPDAALSVWRLLPAGTAPAGIRLPGALDLVFEPPALAASGGRIDFSRDGNSGPYLMYGLSPAKGPDAWTQGPDMAIQFRPEPADRDIVIKIAAVPWLAMPDVTAQSGHLWFNVVSFGSTTLRGPGVAWARIPKALWNSRPVALLVLHFPDARSPSELGISTDTRKMAWSLRTLTTASAAP